MPTSNNVLEEKHERRKTKTNKQNVGFLVTFYIFSSSFLLQELSYSYDVFLGLWTRIYLFSKSTKGNH